MDELFGFITERIMEHLHPSRAAIALLGPDGRSFTKVEVRRHDPTDVSELTISHTLLAAVVEEKKALAFVDVSVDEKLRRAQSIIMQGIHSILCTPLLIGEAVVGVLYVDYLFTQRSISEEDVRLVAQIGRFAAIKLETTRLREEAVGAGAGGLEDDLGVAEADAVAGLEDLVALDAGAVEVRAVGAAQILEHPGVADGEDLGVLAREVTVFDGNRAVRRAANGYGFPLQRLAERGEKGRVDSHFRAGRDRFHNGGSVGVDA
jgi:GAF domain-containing protein